jgi:Response regulator containing CheY-like receiver, AAA-type ATPase, and DNA-binding domains
MNQQASGRILFADDDRSFREPYAALLRRHGYECVTVSDAGSAIAEIRQQLPDVLLADIHMPGNSSLELVEEAAKICQAVPVILLTGYPSVDSAVHSVRLSVAGYLVKPPDLNDLLSQLSSVIPRFRRIRAISENRRRLDQWASDLAALQDRMRASSAPQEGLSDFLGISISNLIQQLVEVNRSVAAWELAGGSDGQKLDLVNAVRHTVDVLEKTRQHFRSKELGELRRQLQTLVSGFDSEEDGAKRIAESPQATDR